MSVIPPEFTKACAKASKADRPAAYNLFRSTFSKEVLMSLSTNCRMYFVLAMLFFTLPGFAQATGNAQVTDPLTAYNKAIQSRDWSGAVAAAQQLVDQNPNSANLNLLAKAQLDSRSAADALATLERALAAAKAEQPAGDAAMAKWKEGLTDIYLGEGSALLTLKRTPEAIAAYNNAAQYASKPAVAYFNLCAISYNNGDMSTAEAACRKSLQADPTMANSWFVLASVLFGNTPVDAKGNMTFSAETSKPSTSIWNSLRMASTQRT